MTMDDNSSVYVGGLSFDSTEDMLRNVFEAYGDILAIKIIYDKESGQSRGFGFVTFTNPRAAVDAIHEMDGGLIGGRTVRVNEVKKLATRTSIREGANGNRELGFLRDRDFFDKERDKSCKRGHRVSSPSRKASPCVGRPPRARSPTQHVNKSPKRGRSSSNHSSPAKKRSRSPHSTPSPRSSQRLQKLESIPSGLTTKLPKRSSKQKVAQDKAKGDLENFIQRRQELERKVAKLESAIENKDQAIQLLQTKTKKVEGRLESLQVAISNRKGQLRKLHSGLLQIQNLSEILRHNEKEFKILTTTFSTKLEDDDVGEIISHDNCEQATLVEGGLGQAQTAAPPPSG